MKVERDQLAIVDHKANTRIYLGKLLIGVITCVNNKYYLDSLDDNFNSFVSEDECIDHIIKCLNGG
jgi:hypothetical protein